MHRHELSHTHWLDLSLFCKTAKCNIDPWSVTWEMTHCVTSRGIVLDHTHIAERSYIDRISQATTQTCAPSFDAQSAIVGIAGAAANKTERLGRLVAAQVEASVVSTANTFAAAHEVNALVLARAYDISQRLFLAKHSSEGTHNLARERTRGGHPGCWNRET